MEPEPLKHEPAAVPPVTTLDYEGPRSNEAPGGPGPPVVYVLVLAFGLLLAGCALGLLGDRMTGGTTWLSLRAIVVLLLVGSVFAWAGALGLWYAYLRSHRLPLPPTTSRATHAVRRLFRVRSGG